MELRAASSLILMYGAHLHEVGRMTMKKDKLICLDGQTIDF